MSFLRYSVLIVIFNISTLVAFNSAIEYYDAASQTYILESNIKGAKKYINDGLTLFPNDPQLTKLGNVIKEEEDQQNKNKNKDNKDQQKNDQDQQKEQQQKEQQQQAQQDESKQDMKKEEAKRLIELYADDADSLNKPQKKANASKGKIQKDW